MFLNFNWMDRTNGAHLSIIYLVILNLFLFSFLLFFFFHIRNCRIRNCRNTEAVASPKGLGEICHTIEQIRGKSFPVGSLNLKKMQNFCYF